MSVTLVCCCQTVGRNKNATEYGGRPQPGDIVLDGDPVCPHGKGHSSPPHTLLGSCLFIMVKRSPMLATDELFLFFIDHFSGPRKQSVRCVCVGTVAFEQNDVRRTQAGLISPYSLRKPSLQVNVQGLRTKNVPLWLHTTLTMSTCFC